MYTQAVVEALIEAYKENNKIKYLSSAQLKTGEQLVLLGNKAYATAVLLGQGKNKVAQCCYDIRNGKVTIQGLKVEKTDAANNPSRGIGIGRTIVEFVEDIARAEGVRMLELKSVKGARDFYRNIGYYDMEQFGSLCSMRKVLIKTDVQDENFTVNENASHDPRDMVSDKLVSNAPSAISDVEESRSTIYKKPIISQQPETALRSALKPKEQ